MFPGYLRPFPTLRYSLFHSHGVTSLRNLAYFKWKCELCAKPLYGFSNTLARMMRLSVNESVVMYVDVLGHRIVLLKDV